jgi:secondary thiamine-phosphate synthase enzyme
MKWLQAGGLADPLCGGPATSFRVATDRVELRTQKPLQMIDITELVEERVRRSAVAEGVLSVQTLHTTAAVVMNENETRLLKDFERLFERLAPVQGRYEHDDLDARWPKPAPDERRNGHAHCRALVLGGSVTLNVTGGRIELGGWQRVFLVELDGPRTRALSIHVLGIAR